MTDKDGIISLIDDAISEGLREDEVRNTRHVAERVMDALEFCGFIVCKQSEIDDCANAAVSAANVLNAAKLDEVRHLYGSIATANHQELNLALGIIRKFLDTEFLSYSNGQHRREIDDAFAQAKLYLNGLGGPRS